MNQEREVRADLYINPTARMGSAVLSRPSHARAVQAKLKANPSLKVVNSYAVTLRERVHVFIHRTRTLGNPYLVSRVSSRA